MNITPIFNREMINGAWTYHDQNEAEFVFFVWPEHSIDSVDDFIEGRQGITLSDAAKSKLKEIRHDAFGAYVKKDFDLMMAHSRALSTACYLYGMRDAAKLGAKFSKGGKSKTYGPIRKAISRLLSKNPSMKNDELWAAIKASPPKGWTALENRNGRYIEGPKAGDDMQYERFCNVASLERKLLKG